jgi:AcrR family transcriptional regulator
MGAERLTSAAKQAERRPAATRSSEATKKRILDAAESEFAAKGFDGARLGNIARVAGVQQALIHHYFADKDGLYREVLAHGLAAMSAEGWQILRRLAKDKDVAKIRPLVEAFAEMLVRFYGTHGALLAILRHDAESESDRAAVATAIVADHVKPVFDAVVAYIEALKRGKKIRKDVHARHLCVSALAMASITTQDERMLRGMWPIDLRSEGFLAERKHEIVEMVLARMLVS